MLVARDRERQQLTSAYESEYSQFVAVYGRRGLGKTTLVEECFRHEFTFRHVGVVRGNLREQLHAFAESLEDAGLQGADRPKTWLEAFSLSYDVSGKNLAS